MIHVLRTIFIVKITKIIIHVLTHGYATSMTDTYWYSGVKKFSMYLIIVCMNLEFDLYFSTTRRWTKVHDSVPRSALEPGVTFIRHSTRSFL